MIKFYSNEIGGFICLSDEVVSKLDKIKESYNEQGGMLFACPIITNEVFIKDISLPSESDNSARFAFNIDLTQANITIKKMFNKGLHYVGDWHSHPQANPQPSSTDIETIKSGFNESRHNLNYLIHIITSNEDIKNSCVMLTDGQKILNCRNYE